MGPALLGGGRRLRRESTRATAAFGAVRRLRWLGGTQILLGWYNLPENMMQPLELVINPQGEALRSKRRVW